MFDFLKKKKKDDESLDDKYKELDDNSDEVDPKDIPDEVPEDFEEEYSKQANSEAIEEVSQDELPVPEENGESDEAEGSEQIPGTTPAPDPSSFSNPRMVKLIEEFNDKKEDPKFLANLWFTIAHSRFIVPIHFSEKPEIGPDGKAKFKEGTQIAFPNLTDPNSPDRHVLPVFTDYDALDRWKALRENEGRPEVTAVSFQDIVVIVGKKLQGFTINPFGPSTLTLGNDAIEMIKNLPGYRAEMERVRQFHEYRMAHKDENVKISILEPKENEEEKDIERELITVAGGSEYISKIGLVVTRPEVPGGGLAYLCVVECPEDKAQEAFKTIGEKIKPHLQLIKRMDFMLLSKCNFADKYFASHPFVYPPF